MVNVHIIPVTPNLIRVALLHDINGQTCKSYLAMSCQTLSWSHPMSRVTTGKFRTGGGSGSSLVVDVVAFPRLSGNTRGGERGNTEEWVVYTQRIQSIWNPSLHSQQTVSTTWCQLNNLATCITVMPKENPKENQNSLHLTHSQGTRTRHTISRNTCMTTWHKKSIKYILIINIKLTKIQNTITSSSQTHTHTCSEGSIL
jgi:hypothetical protein